MFKGRRSRKNEINRKRLDIYLPTSMGRPKVVNNIINDLSNASPSADVTYIALEIASKDLSSIQKALKKYSLESSSSLRY